MWPILKETLKGVLGSKKALAAITALVAGILAKVGLQEPLATQIAASVLAMAGTYVLGQGIADSGRKEALKTEHELAKKKDETS